MAKITKTAIDKDLRDRVFDMLINVSIDEAMERTDDNPFVKINDRQYGTIITDVNGVQRYCRIGVIVAEEREDMTAEELMQSEINAYNTKQEEKAEKAKKKEEKIAKDKAKRQKKQEEEDPNQFLSQEVTI